MGELKGKVINLLGTDIYYEIVGEGIPILMLHGWGSRSPDYVWLHGIGF